jgi:hypothetical protein
MRHLLLVALVLLPALAHTRTIGIFNGAGACPGCPETVAELFVGRGDRVIYLDQHSLNAASLARLDVYGSIEAARTAAPRTAAGQEGRGEGDAGHGVRHLWVGLARDVTNPPADRVTPLAFV